MGKQQTRNTANSYDQNFDDTLRYIIDPNYREQKNKQTESYTNYNRFRQEAFDLSKNKDFLDGSENPHTFQGGLDINSEDPFNELRASRQGGWSELGLFGGRAIAKTGREIINTAGAIGGLAPAIAGQLEDAYTGEDKTTFLQTVFDNAFIKANNEMFDKLNKEFQKTFTRLFRGGEGSLILTNPDDILNSGLEIKALPPGKDIKNTKLLSGGESTLTAIALLFAMLNIRTVPFCILDEVEAALDEANVDMFGKYLEELNTNTQFIIITHKKRTMEYADNLYGITMQESGVSKLVSVKLD